MSDTTAASPSAVELADNPARTSDFRTETTDVLDDVERAKGSEEFADSFHYATMLQLTDKVSTKSLLYLGMSVVLLYFQIVALLGFQMRNSYVFCSSDADCTVAGQYCELSIGICSNINQFRQCSASSDCSTSSSKNYFCSTINNQSCEINNQHCTTDSMCPYSMYCDTNSSTCTNSFNEAVKQDLLPYDYGAKECNTVSDCYQDMSASSLTTQVQGNITAAFSCTNNVCVARQSCTGNETCPVWQYCYVDLEFADPEEPPSGGYCTDFLGMKCLKSDNCTNTRSIMGNVSSEANYKCPWETGKSANGICYYFGAVCSVDTDCKLPGWVCNATIKSYFSDDMFGYCVDTSNGEQNYCNANSYLPLDQGAMVFVVIVICINVAKDLREAIITEMKLRARYKQNKEISKMTCCKKEKGVKSLCHIWIMGFCLFILEAVLFIRKYMFLPLTMAVTASVMNGQGAAGMILNGVAIFFVVEIDNLMYDFFHDKKEKDDMEENGKLELKPRQARYLKLLSFIGAASLVLSLMLLMTKGDKVISAFGNCKDKNSLFRVGGLFIILFLFVGYFISQLMVPILEIWFPTDKKRKSRTFWQSVKAFSFQANASSESRLELFSQLAAILYIIVQGTIGAFVFIGLVEAFYYQYIGKNESKYLTKDPYSDQAVKILADYREAIVENILWYYAWY